MNTTIQLKSTNTFVGRGTPECLRADQMQLKNHMNSFPHLHHSSRFVESIICSIIITFHVTLNEPQGVEVILFCARLASRLRTSPSRRPRGTNLTFLSANVKVYDDWCPVIIEHNIIWVEIIMHQPGSIACKWAIPAARPSRMSC